MNEWLIWLIKKKSTKSYQRKWLLGLNEKHSIDDELVIFSGVSQQQQQKKAKLVETYEHFTEAPLLLKHNRRLESGLALWFEVSSSFCACHLLESRLCDCAAANKYLVTFCQTNPIFCTSSLAVATFISVRICCCKLDPDIISNKQGCCSSCSVSSADFLLLYKHLVRRTFSSKTEIVFHKWKSVYFRKCKKEKTPWKVVNIAVWASQLQQLDIVRSNESA